MVDLAVVTFSVPVIAYLVAFSMAAMACLFSVRRVRLLEDDDTRRGMIWLLVMSAGWAASHVGYLLFPTLEVAQAFHVAGLVFGIATIGPWLYFCSAYTGRRLHHDPRIQQLAVGVFLGIVVLKVTNPIHGLYFTATLSEAPFQHVAMQYGRLHWMATALAYILAGIGYFMLFELFLKAGQRTWTLSALVGVTALPVALNVLADSTDLLVDIGYEPLGVAAFAVGVLYVFTDRFQVVRMTAARDNPVIYLDADGRIRDFNDPARELFPAIAERVNEPLREALPAVADLLQQDEPILEVEEKGRQYYRLTTNRFTFGQSQIGEVLTLSDVTEAENHRRELQRQNERLERFASVVSHDLRNPLNVAASRLELARDDHPDDENLAATTAALDRMQQLIEDVLALARQGQSIGDTEPVTLSALLERLRESIELGDATLTLEADLQFVADEDRVRQLLENLVRNAIDHGDGPVRIRVGSTADDTGFYVADDGPGIPADERESIFEPGHSTAEGGTGFGLAIVSEIAEAHNWDVVVRESDEGGARFEIIGVERQWATASA